MYRVNSTVYLEKMANRILYIYTMNGSCNLNLWPLVDTNVLKPRSFRYVDETDKKINNNFSVALK